jgi:hypothetical protein
LNEGEGERERTQRVPGRLGKRKKKEKRREEAREDNS